MAELAGWMALLGAILGELGSLWFGLRTAILVLEDGPLVDLERLERSVVHTCGFLLLSLLSQQMLMDFLERFGHRSA